MSTENIDDLFRNQLGGHETPPGDDLWARLQAAPDVAPSTPERVDRLFQHKLTTHPTSPPREIWERLEDEHLYPRKRRAAAWWPMAMAAVLALLLLAGGAGLWVGFPGGTALENKVVMQSAKEQQEAERQSQYKSGTDSGQYSPRVVRHLDLATNLARKAIKANKATAFADRNQTQTSETAISAPQQKKILARATRLSGAASNASKVGLMVQQSSRRPKGAFRQPDAAVASSQRTAQATAPFSTVARPADELARAVVASNVPTPVAENVPAATPPTTTSVAALATTATLITVDVRSGPARRPLLATAVASTAAAGEERQGLGGRLLQQVGHAVRGERISLSEMTGLPQNLTLDATIAGRHLSKSIQL